MHFLAKRCAIGSPALLCVASSIEFVLDYLVGLGLGFYWLVVNELIKQLNSLPAVAGRSFLAPFIASVIKHGQNMSEFEIKIITPENWELYKSVRLNSLKESPGSFGSIYDQEVELSDEEWRSRLDLKFRDIDALPLIVELNGWPVGIAWGFIHKPNLQVAHIYQMWVSPELRGQGIAKSLLLKIKAWALGRGCSLMALGVTTSNEAAVNLYKSFGFVAAGQLEELRADSQLLVQPMTIELNSAV